MHQRRPRGAQLTDEEAVVVGQALQAVPVLPRVLDQIVGGPAVVVLHGPGPSPRRQHVRHEGPNELINGNLPPTPGHSAGH